MWCLNESVISGFCALDRIRHPFTAHTKRDVLYTHALSE